MKVPFNDLSFIHEPVKAEILGHISDIISKSSFVLGPYLQEFEDKLADFLGAPYAVGVASGYDALYASLKVLGIGAGDEVIVPAHTFVATAFAVSNVGATPVFVDNDPSDFNLDVSQLAKVVTAKTKAIMPVHLYGQAANMGPICQFAETHKLFIVEDNAQSFGAHYHGKACGTFGQAGCISFYPGKALGSIGEGGAIVTADGELYKKIKALRNVGQYEKGIHELIGVNTRLQPIQAATLSTKIKHYPKEIIERQKIASWYDERLAGTTGVITPKIKKGCDHIYHLYVIRVTNPTLRDELRSYLGEHGIETGIHYPTPVPFQPCYKELGYSRREFPVAQQLTKSIVSLPFFVGLKQDAINYVGDHIEKFMGRMGTKALAS